MNINMIFLILVSVLLFVSLVVIIIQYVKSKTLKELRVKVYAAILVAERAFNYRNNLQKKVYVLTIAWQLLPKFIQPFITEKMLEDLIELWFKEIKDLLDDGKINGSGAEENTKTAEDIKDE